MDEFDGKVEIGYIFFVIMILIDSTIYQIPNVNSVNKFMSLLLKTGRDIGNKFMFGHFMMRPKYFQKCKPRDFSKYIVYPYRAACWRELSMNPNDGGDSLDFGLDGDVFATVRYYPAKKMVVPGERRTWLMIHGSIEFVGSVENPNYNTEHWWIKAKPTKKNVLEYLRQNLLNEHLGLSIDTEGDNLSGSNLFNVYGEQIKEAITEMEQILGRRLPIVAVPKPGGGGFETENKEKINKFFDALVFWDYSSGGKEILEQVKTWNKDIFPKQIGILNDQYSTTPGGRNGGQPGENGYLVWENYVWEAMHANIQFEDISSTVVPFVDGYLDGLSKHNENPKYSRDKCVEKINEMYHKMWPNPQPPASN